MFEKKKTLGLGSLVWAGILTVTLPLLGVMLADEPLAPYFAFPPPQTESLVPGFSTAIATLYFGLCIGAMLLWIFLSRMAGQRAEGIQRRERPRPFPRWGWISLIWVLTFWAIAWTRYPVFQPIQPYTYSFLWFGFIFLLNALILRRGGQAPLSYNPLGFIVLFPLSSLFWWYFEFLNRFVQNWRYENVEMFSSAGYFINGSISFATVLPAIVSMYALLRTLPGLNRIFLEGPAFYPPGRLTSGIIFLLGCGGFLMISWYPMQLYPLLWGGPLMVFLGWVGFRNRVVDLGGLTKGDWRAVGIYAIAALLCGLFWEMWNVHSLAKWTYAIPYLGGLYVFEMPLAGYAGYLFFGIEVLVVVRTFRLYF